MKPIEFVVVAFRSERQLPSCLDAIEAERPGGAGIIVVDNASPDRSGAVAGQHRSRPQVIRSERNLGFGGACNLALAATTAEFVFFINPDARIHAGTTSKLVAALETGPDIAAVGPRIQDPTGAARAASAGSEPSIRSAVGHFLLLGRAPLIGGAFPPFQLSESAPSQFVDWASAAALLCRTKALREVHGFDASLFLYMEDVDLCRRLRATGYRIWYESGATVEHDLGGSQGVEQPRRWYAAFHRYVARTRGTNHARAVDAIAAIGLGARAVVLRRRHPVHGKRLAIAAIEALRSAGSRKTKEPGPLRE